MNTPPPVDLNRLKGILGKSKAVMAKVENTKPITLSEATQREIEHAIDEEPMSQQLNNSNGYTDEQVRNSKFPESVKRAMLEQRIPQLSGPPSKFTLEDMSDLEDIKMTPNKRKPFTKTPLVEQRVTSNSDMITISKSELNEMIQAKLMEFLTTSYNKNLTEDTIKKTINLLIKEGKIAPKKKTL